MTPEGRVVDTIERLVAGEWVSASLAHVALDACRRPPQQSFEGERLVVTGALDHLTREAATLAIELRGGRVARNPSPTTSAVVVGDAPSKLKIERARALGIPVIEGAALRHRLGVEASAACVNLASLRAWLAARHVEPWPAR